MTKTVFDKIELEKDGLVQEINHLKLEIVKLNKMKERRLRQYFSFLANHIDLQKILRFRTPEAVAQRKAIISFLSPYFTQEQIAESLHMDRSTVSFHINKKCNKLQDQWRKRIFGWSKEFAIDGPAHGLRLKKTDKK